MTIRLPIDVAFSDQSKQAEVLEILRAEVRGEGTPTGFDPSEEDDKVVVSFLTCVVQGYVTALRPGSESGRRVDLGTDNEDG